jgi:hypothetical protein
LTSFLMVQMLLKMSMKIGYSCNEQTMAGLGYLSKEQDLSGRFFHIWLFSIL